MAASETTGTDVVVDVVEDPHCDFVRDDCDDAGDYFRNDDDDEVLDVEEDDDDEEFQVRTPSRADQTNKHPFNERPSSQQPFTQNQVSIDLTTEEGSKSIYRGLQRLYPTSYRFY